MHLKEFDSDRLADIVRGGRFEHFILVPSKCEVRHHRWIRHTFSVDVGHYSFATRAAGRFPKNRVCVGYMRSVTEPTWVNGFEFGTDLIQYYPPGTEVNYRAGPNGEWALIQLDEPSLQAAARERLGVDLTLPLSAAFDLRVPTANLRTLDRLIERSIQHRNASARLVRPIISAVVDLLSRAQNIHSFCPLAPSEIPCSGSTAGR
ncbi:MAG: hypothetical protein WA771_07035 [Chthoniobacterales bacterium]